MSNNNNSKPPSIQKPESSETVAESAARKKRDLQHGGADDDDKKLKVDSANGDNDKKEEKVKKLKASEPCEHPPQHHQPARQTPLWDLESALHRIVRVGGDVKELISSSSSSEDEPAEQWIKFRVGHAGDASVIANCYRKSHHQVTTTKEDQQATKATSDDASSLEVRLADGLGDEDKPPSVYALLAEVCSSKNDDDDSHKSSSSLVAVALLTTSAGASSSSSRALRIEWLYLDEQHSLRSVIERRMWLRLSSLAVMTGLKIIVMETSRQNTSERSKTMS